MFTTTEKKKSIDKYKSRLEIKKDLPIGQRQDFRVQQCYDRQFKSLDRYVLWGLDDEIVKDYAKDHLDLKDEDENDCDCKDISDFEDNELMAEISSRNFFGYANSNIISVDLFTRISRIINFASNQDLEVKVILIKCKNIFIFLLYQCIFYYICTNKYIINSKIMGTYELSYGGKKEIAKGVNLESALTSLGFVVKDIKFESRRKSNAKYIAICEDGMSIRCAWLEKIEKIKNLS